MKRIRLFFLAGILLLTASVWLQAQNNSLLEYNTELNQINRVSMSVLSGWAVLNFIGFGTASFFTRGQLQSFCQMNALWNVVNMAIAFPALYQSLVFDPANYDLSQSITAHFNLEKAFLLNTGLDVAYIVTGFLLMEISNRSSLSNPGQLKGFGQGLILQGGFLIVFDLVMYFIHANHFNQLKALL
ncbi:MAG: hypothetical protein JXR70_16100 [Spirochaetales bacterium]|nr:hypothetical protein [Spirochaetales bacterium]